MATLPKWTERSDIKWRPVSEKPGNTGDILVYLQGLRERYYRKGFICEDTGHLVDSHTCLTFTDKEHLRKLGQDLYKGDPIKLIAWAWVCWDKT